VGAFVGATALGSFVFGRLVEVGRGGRVGETIGGSGSDPGEFPIIGIGIVPNPGKVTGGTEERSGGIERLRPAIAKTCARASCIRTSRVGRIMVCL
jgi:hypothetical protein